MLRWRFRTYVSASGRNDVKGEIARLAEDGKANLRARVLRLSTASPALWTKPAARKLQGFDDLYEIRFRNRRVVETRAIGFFGCGSVEFTILVVCTHKDRVYKPADAFDTAQRRRRALLAQEASTAPLEIDGEEFPEDEE